MKFASLKNAVCILATVGALCVGGNLSAAQILLFAPAAKPVLGDALWTSFIAATNARNSENVFNTGVGSVELTNATWNTNCPLYGQTGFTGFSLEGNWNFVWTNNAYMVPVTALTPRHVYWRGHSTGGTNGQFFPAPQRDFYLHFLTADNRMIYAYVIAVKKGLQDYNVAILSNDLPADIQPVCMVDPSALSAKLASQGAWWWPRHDIRLGTCQHNLVGGLLAPVFSKHSFYVGGDSGSPDFYLLNGQVVMTGGRTTSGWCPQMQADCDQLTLWAGLDPASYQIQLLNLNQFQ